MQIELIFRVEDEMLRIEIQQAHLSEIIPNLMAIYRPEQKIVAFGETPEMLEKSAPPKLWAKTHNEIDFLPILNVEDFHEGRAYSAIQLYLYRGFAKARPAWPYRVAFLDQANCSIWFPGYEQVALRTRQDFEFNLQRSLDIHVVRINGQEAGWSYRTLKAAQYSLSLVRWGTAAILAGGVFFVPAVVFPEIFKYIVLAALFAATVLLRWDAVAGVLAAGWIVAVRRRLPESLVRYTLLASLDRSKRPGLTPLEESLLKFS